MGTCLVNDWGAEASNLRTMRGTWRPPSMTCSTHPTAWSHLLFQTRPKLWFSSTARNTASPISLEASSRPMESISDFRTPDTSLDVRAHYHVAECCHRHIQRPGRAAALDIHAYIIQCNNRRFGDSRIRLDPTRSRWAYGFHACQSKIAPSCATPLNFIGQQCLAKNSSDLG
jgi:hypothetical protein